MKLWGRLCARVGRYNRDTARELERQDREGDYGPAMRDVEAVEPRVLLPTLPVSFVAYCAAFGFGFSLLAGEPPTVRNVVDTGLAFAAAMTLCHATWDAWEIWVTRSKGKGPGGRVRSTGQVLRGVLITIGLIALIAAGMVSATVLEFLPGAYVAAGLVVAAVALNLLRVLPGGRRRARSGQSVDP